MKKDITKIFKRVIAEAKPFWFLMLMLLLLTFLVAPIALLKPLALKVLIDSGFGTQSVPPFFNLFLPSGLEYEFQNIVIVATVFTVLIAFLENINTYITWVLSTIVGEKLVLNLRTKLFDHVQRLSIAYHDSKGTTDSLYRIQWDTMSIRALLLAQLPPLISSSFTLIAMLVVMLMVNWQFALISLCIIPPIYLLAKISNKKLIKDWYDVKNSESVAMAVVNEVLSSLRIVKAFGQEDSENERFQSRSNKAIKGQIKLAKTAAGYSFIIGMLLAIASASFIYLGATFVQSKQMTLGELTLIIAYLTQIFGPLQSIVKNTNDIQGSIAGVDRVFTVLSESKEVQEKHDAIHLLSIKGEFEFKNVGFSYTDRKHVLDDVSFKIQPGDRVGIMGSTGAGKSTLISLLMRFYDPLSGVIKIDGVDIKNYKLEGYRKQFSIVLQDPVLFSTSLKENISYGKPEATEQEIIDAAIAANAHNFILKTHDGYDTTVGERGMQLSGGERQRISIARAFIKNAPILILDEPTSSLDIKTEALIMEAMERLMEGKTTFMITHRLDTLKTCNVILHLEHGRLKEVIRDHDESFIANKKLSLLN